MKKFFVLVFSAAILSCMQASFASGIGYIDFEYISKNYPVAQKYNATIRARSQEIKAYAQQKDSEIAKAKTAAAKEKIKKDAINQVKIKQKDLASLRSQYEADLNQKIRTATERVRLEKGLDIILKDETRVAGGINCSPDVVKVLKSLK